MNLILDTQGICLSEDDASINKGFLIMNWSALSFSAGVLEAWLNLSVVSSDELFPTCLAAPPGLDAVVLSSF